jgi:RimJ/RimL family protein N-acetyltransferase
MADFMEIKMAKSLDAVNDMRKERLARLSEPQEYFLEEQAARSKPYLIVEDGTMTGYTLVSDGNTLIEFFCSEMAVLKRRDLLKHVVHELKIKKAFCQTFDHDFLSVAMLLKPKIEAEGTLFRKFDPFRYWNTHPKGLEYKTATKKDYDLLRGINDGFFESDEELRGRIDRKELTVFYSDKHLVGCGFMLQTIPGINAYDIGMMVAPAFRRQGFGAYIAYRMASECIAAGHRPVAGCGVDNTASLKALENAGFISQHLIIELKMK